MSQSVIIKTTCFSLLNYDSAKTREILRKYQNHAIPLKIHVFFRVYTLTEMFINKECIILSYGER